MQSEHYSILDGFLRRDKDEWSYQPLPLSYTPGLRQEVIINLGYVKIALAIYHIPIQS